MNLIQMETQPKQAAARLAQDSMTSQRDAHRGKSHRGWTLVECCATLAVASVLAGAASGSFTNLIDRLRLDSDSKRFLADLQYLKSEVLSRNEGMRISFGNDAGGSCYVLHGGAPNECTCSSRGDAGCQSPGTRVLKTVSLPQNKGITITTNVASIYVDPRLGTSSPAGTVRMVDKQGRSVHHVISIRGRVRACSESVPTTNLPKC